MNLKSEDQLSTLFNKLVPDSGNCDTIEGEMVRAAMRIAYRYYNDGDVYYIGYGCETAGPAVSFLYNCREIDKETREKLQGIIDKGASISDYEKYFLENLFDTVSEYVLSKNGEYTKTTTDMFEFEPMWTDDDDEEDEDPWDEDEDWDIEGV